MVSKVKAIYSLCIQVYADTPRSADVVARSCSNRLDQSGLDVKGPLRLPSTFAEGGKRFARVVRASGHWNMQQCQALTDWIEHAPQGGVTVEVVTE